MSAVEWKVEIVPEEALERTLNALEAEGWILNSPEYVGERWFLDGHDGGDPAWAIVARGREPQSAAD